MCRSVITTKKAKWDETFPEMEVTKITPTSFEYWHSNFTSVVGIQTSLSVISLDYLILPGILCGYSLYWPSIEDKFHHLIRLNGQRFKTNSKSLY